MKVVLFCGGQGLRLRPHSERVPKPMVTVGCRPIIWNLMKYDAHFGHRDFILCLGHRADSIRAYFNGHGQHRVTDARLSHDEGPDDQAAHDIREWRITFADTGEHTNVGGRLMKVRHYLEGEDEFLANYTDTLSDVDLRDVIAGFRDSGAVAGFVAVRPAVSAHIITTDGRGMVESIGRVADADIWSNGGYLVFKHAIFDHMREGEELVEEPFWRLIQQQGLYAHKHRGFWSAMDTFKEKQQLDDLFARGHTPWEVWKRAQ
jgi:glucose-1-phosphate cytidylyltransferase